MYHQSAAANALLYVGLGTVAIGSVIFFVGTGEKGFKTLELRLIGPTLVACGLLCCLIRVLLCACPSTCIRRRKKTRLKNVCPHNSSRYPLNRVRDKKTDFVPLEHSNSNRQKKKVCIAPGNPIPSTSTMNFQETLPTQSTTQNFLNHNNDKQEDDGPYKPPPPSSIPIITVPDFADFNNETDMKRDDSLIELQNLDMHYELQSVSSCDSDTVVEIESRKLTKHTRNREPIASSIDNNNLTTTTTTTIAARTIITTTDTATDNTTTVDIDNTDEDEETCLSVVIEQTDKRGDNKTNDRQQDRVDNNEKISHSGIVLSPLQLGQ